MKKTNNLLLKNKTKKHFWKFYYIRAFSRCVTWMPAIHWQIVFALWLAATFLIVYKKPDKKVTNKLLVKTTTICYWKRKHKGFENFITFRWIFLWMALRISLMRDLNVCNALKISICSFGWLQHFSWFVRNKSMKESNQIL